MHLHTVELEGSQEMNIEETARDAAIASAGSKTALTSGGLLAGLGFLSSEWVFGLIGAAIGVAGLCIQFYFQKRSREDKLRQAADADRLARDADRRAQEVHSVKMQLLLKQLNGGQPGDAQSIIASTPPARPKQSPGLQDTDFGGLTDD